MRNKLLCLLLAAALTALTGCSLAQPEQKTAFEDRWIGFYVVYNPPGAYNNFSSNPNLVEMGTTSLDTGEYGALTFPREVLLGVEDPDTGNITFPDLEGYSLFIRHRQDEYGPVTQTVSDMSPGEEGTHITSSDQGTAETADGVIWWGPPLDAPADWDPNEDGYGQRRRLRHGLLQRRYLHLHGKRGEPHRQRQHLRVGEVYPPAHRPAGGGVRR